MRTIKKLDISNKEFMANGRKYLISDKISIKRFAEYQKLQPKLTFGLGFEDIFKNLKQAYAQLNKQNFADAAIIIHNVMNGITNVDDSARFHPALKMAALFINYEGEDTANYDEKEIENKILDWAEEGFSMMDFFTLSLSSISGFSSAYQEYIQKNTIKEDQE